MPKTKKKSVSNEKLADMIAKGFESVDEKLADKASRKDVISLEGKMGLLEDRFTIVERKLDQALYKEFQRIDKLEKRMETVEGKLGISNK